MPLRFLLLLIFSSSLFAQASYFGDRVPLTNTRYGAMHGMPVVVSDGANLFTFVSTTHDMRMARPGDAMARPLLDAVDGDAVWNGSRFLVAGTSRGSIVARLVDANGVAGDVFTLVEQGMKPRLAFDGERIVLLYEHGGALHSLLLTRDGVASGSGELIAMNVRDFDLVPNAALLATNEGVKLVSLSPNATIEAETRVTDAQTSAVSLATDGASLLALWSRDGGIDAATIADGITSEAFAVAENAIAPSVTWSGGEYHAAFVENDAMRIARIDAATHTVVAGDLALDAAAEQTLAAAISTPNAALLVWNESGDARLGIRTRNGAWRERLLADDEDAVAAAADGQSFVVVTENASGWSAAFLDENGALLRQSPRVSAFRARDVALANEAMVVGGTDGNIVAMRVARDGSVSEPVALTQAARNPVIATDGTSFVAAWETVTTKIEALLIGSGAAPATLTSSEGADPAIAFNGTHYVAAWKEGENVRLRRVTTGGERVSEIVQISAGGTAPAAIRLAPLGTGVGLTWHDGRAQLAHIDFATEAWTIRTARGFETPLIAAPRMLALPNGSVAFLQSEAGDEPHLGSARVSMAVAHPAPAVAPEAPAIVASTQGGDIHVSWNAQPVSGYRVEYRSGDGPWLEAEAWADGDATSLSFHPPGSGTYSIRVRAWSDGGTSAYSAPASVNVSGGKRRAAR